VRLVSTIEALKLFNEKAQRLRDSRFIEILKNSGTTAISLQYRKDEGVQIESTLPDTDSIDAFVLNIRFFIQNNEKSSFENISKIYDELNIENKYKVQVEEARKELNSYLDSESHININNKKITRRNIFDTYIYGGLAHANPQKKKIYDEWMKEPMLSQFLNFEFVNILTDFIRIINYIASINLEVINRYNT